MSNWKKISAAFMVTIMSFYCFACGAKEAEVPTPTDTGVTDVVQSESESIKTDEKTDQTAAETQNEAETKEDTQQTNEDSLPMFSYNQVMASIGIQPLEAAAYDYLASDYMKDYDKNNVLIPFVNIVELDETNSSDALLYGDYYLYEFKKDGDTLVNVSGGHCPGIIHLERTGEGDNASYSPLGKMDEAYTDNDAKTVFGEYYDHYLKLSSDDHMRDSGLAQVISDYVAANELDIKKYQIGEEVKELPTTHVKHVTGSLPKYEYPGPEAFYYFLYGYLIDTLQSNFNENEVCIPCPVLVYEDFEDKQDIKIYGDFWVFNYYLDGETMMNSSGGSFPGCIHIKDNGGDYEVTSFEMVGDGNQFEPTAKKIFGDHYDDFMKITNDTEGRDKLLAQIIANYVAANELKVTAIKDFGWDPVPLPEENIDSFYSVLD